MQYPGDDTDGAATDPERRALMREILRAVKAAVPAHIAVAARISGNDWVEGGAGPEDAVALARELNAFGLAYACVTSGGISPLEIYSAARCHFLRSATIDSGVPYFDRSKFAFLSFGLWQLTQYLARNGWSLSRNSAACCG